MEIQKKYNKKNINRITAYPSPPAVILGTLNKQDKRDKRDKGGRAKHEIIFCLLLLFSSLYYLYLGFFKSQKEMEEKGNG